MPNYKIPVEISARHIHLCVDDVEKLFGSGYELKPLKKLSQPNQFAAEETVRVVGPKNQLEKVRVVGPTRRQTQIEISLTDSYFLGIQPKVTISGELNGSTGGLVLIGTAGQVELSSGVIAAQRHLHIPTLQAKAWNIKHKSIVSVNIKGKRALTFHEVVVRSRPDIDELAFHVDTDEANAAGISSGDEAELIVE